MQTPDFPTPDPIVILLGMLFVGIIAVMAVASEVIIPLLGIIIAIATCICVIGGAVLIMRKLQESN